MVAGKSKGNSFERYVSKELSLWWSQYSRDDLFWRTHNSGGRHTIRKQKNMDTHHQEGDITNIHPDGESLMNIFVIECKHYKSINLWSLITGSRDTINEWWDKLNDIATKENKLPLLIVKENRKPILVFSDKTFADFYRNTFDRDYNISFYYNEQPVYGYLFGDFINTDSRKFLYLLNEVDINVEND